MANEHLQNRAERWELPTLIDTPYPYISIRDISDMANIFAPDMSSEEITLLEDMLQDLKKGCAPEACTFYSAESGSLADSIESMVDTELGRSDKIVGVVHMDRYIGKHQAGPRVGRLELSRDSSGKLTTRTGAELSYDQQLDVIAEMTRGESIQELIFVDDVVAFGDTLPIVISQLCERLEDDVDIRVIVGIAVSGGSWNGYERVLDETGIRTEYLTKAIASEAILDGTKGLALPVSRDLTMFGGRVTTLEDGSKHTHPYMLPFMKPFDSVMRREAQYEASMRYLAFNIVLIDALERSRGRPIFVSDLIDASIGYPYTDLSCLKGIMERPSHDMTLKDYVSYAMKVLEDNVDAIIAECQPKPGTA